MQLSPTSSGQAEQFTETSSAGTPIPRNSGAPPPVVLTIAGFDPSSGAGVTADLKVFAAHRMYGLSVITALTVQSTLGVRGTEPVAPEYIHDSLRCLVKDFCIDGVKIGMLADEAVVREVAFFLEGLRARSQSIPVVLDPVLRSSSGSELLSAAGVDELRRRLVPLVTCVTPNRAELAVLTGEADLSAAAAALLDRGPAVVVTGGDGEQPDDYVLTRAGEHWLRGVRIETTADHGTGCAFSSALLCGLVRGMSMVEAAASAKEYVTRAMDAAYPLGHGHGPMHHLFAFDRP